MEHLFLGFLIGLAIGIVGSILFHKYFIATLEDDIAKAKENIEALKIKMVDKEKQVEAIVASDIKTVETAVVNEVEKIQKAI